MTPDEKKARGIQAKQLLENPLIVGFVQELDRSLYNKYRHSTSSAERDQIHGITVCLDAFVQQMRTYLQSGELEQKLEEREDERNIA